MKSVFFYVQHLLGVGHLHRASVIARAIAEQGVGVTLVNGGFGQPQVDDAEVEVVPLPPVKSDPLFSELYGCDGSPVSEDFRHDRRDRLLQTFAERKPDLLLIESFPFARRQMRFELVPLLERSISMGAQRPVVACSVRDVIQPKANASRTEETVDTIHRYFDHIFVHGDPELIDFSETFPECDRFQEKLVYTGYVTKRMDSAGSRQRSPGLILVSAGGGVVGESVYNAAIDAALSKRGRRFSWHLLVGENLPQQSFQSLLERSPDNCRVERNRPDFLDLVQECAVSVSQGGYNTVMDLIVTRTPAIVVPFELNGELEQITRAREFENRGLLDVLRESELTGRSLISRIEKVAARDHRESSPPLVDGAERMARFLQEL